MESRAAEMQIRSRYKIPDSRQSKPSTTKRARVGRAGPPVSSSRASAEEKVMNGSIGRGAEARRRIGPAGAGSSASEDQSRLSRGLSHRSKVACEFAPPLRPHRLVGRNGCCPEPVHVEAHLAPARLGEVP